MSDLGALPVQAYLAACLLAGVIGVWLGRVAWVDRDEPGGTEVSLYLFCGGAVSLLYAVRVASASELAMIVALNLSTPLVAAVPGIWMAFVLAFSGHDRWRTENRTVALAAPPFVWVLTAWSSGTHGLSRRSLAAVVEGPFTLLSFGLGIADVAFVLYAYGLCIAGVLVVVDLYRRTGNRYRLQTFVILLGTLFPFLGGIVTVVDVGSYARLSRGSRRGSWSTASSCTGPSSGSGLDAAAVVARDTAVEVMQDPVIVAGSDGRIRDLNPAAEELLPSDAVGSSLSNVPALGGRGGTPDIDRRAAVRHPRDPITDPRGTDRGHVFLLRDVTERERRQTELERREVELERQNERLEDFAGVVSHDLRNPLAAATAAVESSLATATGTTRTHSTAPRTPTSGWTT